MRFSPTLLGFKETILIVEDHALVRAVIYETLMAHGYIATATDDLQEAFKVCRDFDLPIHLIVADMSGRASLGLQQLQSGMASFVGMKVLLIIDPFDAERERVKEGLAYPHIEKPFTPQELVQKLEDILFVNRQGRSSYNSIPPEHGLHGRS